MLILLSFMFLSLGLGLVVCKPGSKESGLLFLIAISVAVLYYIFPTLM